MPAAHIHPLQCVLCGARYDTAEVIYTCPACGALGVLEVHYDYERIARNISRVQLAEDRNPTIWRYRALLPISYSHKNISSLAIGGTPLYPVKRLREYLGMKDLWLKDDTRNPSASLKDRASFIAVLLAEGKTVACASTANAASPLAGVAESLGLPADIFVRHIAPRPTLVQRAFSAAFIVA